MKRKLTVRVYQTGPNPTFGFKIYDAEDFAANGLQARVLRASSNAGDTLARAEKKARTEAEAVSPPRELLFEVEARG